MVKRADQQYDYIVHDVFTGGAEPVDLFTVEFLGNLHKLLKPDGAIAIVRTLIFPPKQYFITRTRLMS